MMSRLTSLCLLLLACFTAELRAQYIYTFAGNAVGATTGTGSYTGDGGQAKLAGLNSCTGVCNDGAGNIYIADKSNNVVRKVNTAGIISTFAGTSTAGYSGNNGPAVAAKLNQPYAVATDRAGNVYIADYGNSVVRKVNTAGTITTYAGTGTAGYSGDMGSATLAQLNHPQGLAVDTTGNLYIADFGNHAVRLVTPAGVMTTFAGNGINAYSGDGTPATNASLNGPAGVAIDPFGQVYIADYFNHRVRKVDASGIMHTVAGTGSAGIGGDGGAAVSALLHFPASVAVFGFDQVYISDQGNNAVRMVNGSGTISTVAGNFTNGYLGDGGLAVNAELSSPKGIAVNALNQLYIADYDNNVVRIVRSFTAVNQITGNAAALKVYPNPAHGAFSIEVPATGSAFFITVTDVFGRVVVNKTENAARKSFDITGLQAGNYFIRVSSGGNTWREQVTVW